MSTLENRPMDRSTADRIIQRALQLDAERADGLTEAQVGMEIAAELCRFPSSRSVRRWPNSARAREFQQSRLRRGRRLDGIHVPAPSLRSSSSLA